MAKKHGLGRGLNALLNPTLPTKQPASGAAPNPTSARPSAPPTHAAPESATPAAFDAPMLSSSIYAAALDSDPNTNTNTRTNHTSTSHPSSYAHEAPPKSPHESHPSTYAHEAFPITSPAPSLEIPLYAIEPGPFQPRVFFDPEELEFLAESVRQHGVIQPIVVRPKDKEPHRYEIIAGERRYRAAKLANLKTIPAVIKAIPVQSAHLFALIENIQRENLNPIEESLAFDRLIKEFNLTHSEVAESVGKSRAAISNALRLLTLQEEVKEMLRQNVLEVGHAKVLAGLDSPHQIKLAKQIAEKGLSVRETERQANLYPSRSGSGSNDLNSDYAQSDKDSSTHSGDKSTARKEVSRDVLRLEQSLSERLCATVQIHNGPKGKGKVVIHYNSLDELDGILEHFQ